VATSEMSLRLLSAKLRFAALSSIAPGKVTWIVGDDAEADPMVRSDVAVTSGRAIADALDAFRLCRGLVVGRVECGGADVWSKDRSPSVRKPVGNLPSSSCRTLLVGSRIIQIFVHATARQQAFNAAPGPQINCPLAQATESGGRQSPRAHNKQDQGNKQQDIHDPRFN
jgi:hypothetical protein